MSLIIGTENQIEAYYASDALGQSKLKKLLKDVSSFHLEEDSTAAHFVIGSAVDCLLTAKEGVFEEKYYVSNLPKTPSDSIIDIISIVHQRVLEDYTEHLEVVMTGNEDTSDNTPFKVYAGDLATWSAYILDACEQTGWQPRWGEDAKLKNVLKDGSEYFQDLCGAFGKVILSASQYETIIYIVQSLKTNPRTSSYFEREFFSSENRLMVYYQLPIYFMHKGIKCKALLDMVIVEINHDGEIISVTPIDFKTMNGNTYHFIYSLKTRRYDIQAAWYTLALMSHFHIEIDRVKPFQFVVESTTSIGKPLVFKLSPSLLEIGFRGKPEVMVFGTNTHEVISPKILGIEQLINLYLYHMENGFHLEREIQEAGLEPLEIDWEGITTKS